MVNLKAIGKSLRKIRLLRGLTLAQLSNLTSVSLVTVHNIEKGLYEPKISTLNDLCTALNVPIDQFIRPKINDVFIKIPQEFILSNPNPRTRKKQPYSDLPKITRMELVSDSETVLNVSLGQAVTVYLVFGRVEVNCGANNTQLMSGDTLHLESYQDVIVSAIVNSLLLIIL